MRRDRVIMFDLGGVLIENHGKAELTAMLPLAPEPHDIWIRWLASPSVRGFERGMLTPEQFSTAFVAEWQIALEPSAFIQAFATWPKRLFEGAEELLHALKQQHHLACLSNTNAIHWERFPQLHALFDSRFLSHEMGLVKPDREAFEYALEHLNARPGDVYYFDDLLLNVSAAREAGMSAFHVEVFSEIEPILHGEGLYVRADA